MNSRFYSFLSFIFLGMMVLIPVVSHAQCAMCAAVAETSKENGSSAAIGLNNGILYLFLTPYLLVAAILFFWLRARKKANAAQEE